VLAADPLGPDHDVLFREGVTKLGQQTYTPRLLLYDKRGSLRALSKVRGLVSREQDLECV
jgi:hypothetical protein